MYDMREKADSGTSPRSYVKEALFLGSVACLGVIGGFAMTVSRVKKRNPASFMKGVLVNADSDQMESGASVGLKALGWGTILALAGVGSISFGVCKLMGVNSVEEFKVKFQSFAPAIKRKDAAEVEATMSELQSGIFHDKKGG